MLQPRTSYPVTERVTFPIESRYRNSYIDPEPVKPYAFIKRPKGMTGEHWEAYKIAKLSEMRQKRNAKGERCALRRGRETREGIEILRVC